MRRGTVRDAILRVLAEQPMHGYQVMQELSERTGGRWQPSAGSIYPTLQQLEDEGLVTAEDRTVARRSPSPTRARPPPTPSPPCGPGRVAMAATTFAVWLASSASRPSR